VSLQLKQEKPSADLIKQLFAREAHPSDNVTKPLGKVFSLIKVKIKFNFSVC
jgi:hypothetical protein